MSTETEQSTQVHGGRLVAKRLKAHGVTKLFTLSGGHLFSIYDGCREEGIDLVDVRHESAATFAAEGWAKVTRQPGVAALTAGPGVTNGMSAIASAQQNGSPILVLGGRAPAMRWGQGSLQELDHVPFVRPLTKLATTAEATAEIPGLIDDALTAAVTPHSGPDVHRLPDGRRLHGGAAEPASPRRCRTPRGRPGARRRPRRHAAARRRAPGDHGRHEPLLGPRRGRAAGARARSSASPSSSTAWRAAACPRTTSSSSPARAPTA